MTRIAYTQKCIVAPLDTRIALRAADLHRQYKLATADAIVYATAQAFDAELLTCGAHFEKLPGVVFVKKQCKTNQQKLCRSMLNPLILNRQAAPSGRRAFPGQYPNCPASTPCPMQQMPV